MKLSELKVGMRIRQSGWPKSEWLEIEWISGKFLSGHDEHNQPFAQEFDDHDGFQLVDPRKKPSDLVRASVSGRMYLTSQGVRSIASDCRESGTYANDRIDAILKYLDEQAEQK